MTLSEKYINKAVTVHNIPLELHKTCQCAFSKFYWDMLTQFKYLHRYDHNKYLCSYANIISIPHIHLLLFNFQQNWTVTVNLMKIYLATVKLFNKDLNLLGCDAVTGWVVPDVSKGCHAFKMLGNQWPNDMTAHPRRCETSKMLLWEVQILSVLHAYR
jgi:hypothetical protein